jgi:hypothetical protein
MAKPLEIIDIIRPDNLAVTISNTYNDWETKRTAWRARMKEIREYIFATSTGRTSNEVNPWKNSTHIPKLCQIRDNLHSNYMAALFPSDRPIVWESDDEEGDDYDKRKSIQSYIENKTRLGNFETEMSKSVLDFIDFGNCFGRVEFVAEKTTDPLTGENIPGFIGPKFRRVSPLDISFDPTSPDFASTPKIIRSLKTMGTLKSMVETRPDMTFLDKAFDRSFTARQQFQGLGRGDVAKNDAYQMDGFGSFLEYFQSDYVEVLEYFGDIWDHETNKLKQNQYIVIIDRSFIAYDGPNPTWLADSGIYHAGWRLRPDNLYAMGPLENLVGMQYRIDHLENAKADGFDLIVHPVIKIRGYVEDFDYEPGARIFVSEEGDVEFMRPDVTMLNADTQIQMYEAKMEEMAGAPKQAMGFRTPGEKTAYEVQILENGANRVFVNKTSYFERMFVEPILNSMLEVARRNMGPSDLIRVFDDDYGVASFMKVTKEDITARGKIRPVAARHFARNATIIQNLTSFANSPLGQDPAIMAHVSGKKIARLVFEELLGLDRYELVQDNIRIAEQTETQQQVQAAQQQLTEESTVNENSLVPVPPEGQAGPV